MSGGQLSFYSYVLNSPLRFTDPTGRVIVVNGSPQQHQDYLDAIAYLGSAPAMARVISILQNSRTDYHINFNNLNDDSFNPATNTINWDSRSGCSCSAGNGIQSPALGLGHEMAHAAIAAWLGNFLANIGLFAGDYDNWEEWRVITGAEQQAARALGEPVRMDHRCSYFPRVSTPTDHIIFPTVPFPQTPGNVRLHWGNSPYQ